MSENNLTPVERLPKRTGLFTNYIFKTIPLAFDESMSYYETLCGLLDYLKNSIKPVIDNNAIALQELQDYVVHYFDNLDVQEEINNKLDQMAEDGTLQEIIAEYLETQAIFCFDTVDDLKTSTNLVDGSYAKTLGFNTLYDGGSSLYKIVDDNEIISNDANIIELNNGLKAILIIENNTIKTMQFGCIGDGETDDTDKIQLLFDYVKDNYDTGCTIFVNGLHYIETSIEISGTNDNKLSNISLIGLNGNRGYNNMQTLKYGFIFNATYDTAGFNTNYGILIDNTQGFTIKYLNFTTNETVSTGAIPLNNISLIKTSNSSNVYIENCNFTKAYTGYFSYANGLAIIKNNNFALNNIGLKMLETGDSQIENNYFNTNGGEIYNLDGTLKSAYTTLYSSNLVYGFGVYIGGGGNCTFSGGKIEWNNLGIWQDYTTNVIYNNIQFDRCALSGITISGHNNMINRTNINNCNFTGCGGITPTSSYTEKHVGGYVNASICASGTFGLTIVGNKFIGDNGRLHGAFKTSNVYYAPNRAIYFNYVFNSIFTNNIIELDTSYIGEVINSELLFDNNIGNKNIYFNTNALLYSTRGIRKVVYNTTSTLTEGNFESGDQILNGLNPTTGWRCTSSGTFRTINTTVSVVTTASDYFPNDNTVIDCGTSYVQGIRTGSYINITGVTGTKKITGVIFINGHYYAKLNTACDNVVTNATTTNQAPVFTEIS